MNASTYNLPLKLRTTSSGFTLIELMVTIAVLAIIVGIATPSINSQLANQRVKSTTATLANALKEAKNESLIRRQSITLSYDNNSNPKMINITDADAGKIASYRYDSKSIIKSSKTSIDFEPSKRVDAAITYTVCDKNTSIVPRQVNVSKLANINIKAGVSC
ncbi:MULTISPECIES: prepilin-type N-terminal cleavage/methylation domain-containing protein [unclassified Psychrobacter]|uniref:pilus assembly FimT family protein n=1 Tax=unclassified Psychrobacter TaxID=196806 RepID=UPI0025B3945B|nr:MULTISPECIES: prepilin-type N-terminal cleavage/methylation domain-containing protein [unclassified Psychrobacter]MDN3454207.1 prepilin-type N-terminal cleavage/methylation domain-containing protein [Psychrobacter sp. APC 3350]MDN3501396.1 prepilin-type N-terminal cleavage/methylation domain-containing protein [Psychrobacter sp. 5A.1]